MRERGKRGIRFPPNDAKRLLKTKCVPFFKAFGSEAVLENKGFKLQKPKRLLMDRESGCNLGVTKRCHRGKSQQFGSNRPHECSTHGRCGRAAVPVRITGQRDLWSGFAACLAESLRLSGAGANPLLLILTLNAERLSLSARLRQAAFTGQAYLWN